MTSSATKHSPRNGRPSQRIPRRCATREFLGRTDSGVPVAVSGNCRERASPGDDHPLLVYTMAQAVEPDLSARAKPDADNRAGTIAVCSATCSDANAGGATVRGRKSRTGAPPPPGLSRSLAAFARLSA